MDAPSEDDVVSAGTLTQDDVWPEQVTWRWPVSGEIERGYSVEALSYDVTMADWRTHDGVDILAQQGEVVVAAGDGEVVSVTQDDLYGTTVVIDHGSGIKTQYSNLADTPTVSPGDKVKRRRCYRLCRENGHMRDRAGQPHALCHEPRRSQRRPHDLYSDMKI